MEIAHKPLLDPIVQRSLSEYHRQQTADMVDLESWRTEDYLDTFDQWIKDSSYNSITGLDVFANKAYSGGALESIVSFVHRHCRHRRLRFSQAEFVGSKIASNHCRADWLYLESQSIDRNDALILSLPFAGTGNEHSEQQSMLDQCNRLGVPVLLDIAYFGISYDVDINVDQPCVTDVVFSLSKCISAPLRLGMRYCRIDHDDMVQVNSDLRMINRWAVDLGIKLMNQYSHDWFIDRYRPLQKQICHELELAPSRTLTLAQGHDPAYLRNGYNRVCITDEIHSQL